MKDKKTMYHGVLFSAEITRKELKKMLRTTPENRWERELRGYAIDHDQAPQYYGQATENKDIADNTYDSHFRVYIYPDVAYISCTATEEFTARIIDDEGHLEFYEGSNYDYMDSMSEETLAELKNLL